MGSGDMCGLQFRHPGSNCRAVKERPDKFAHNLINRGKGSGTCIRSLRILIEKSVKATLELERATPPPPPGILTLLLVQGCGEVAFEFLLNLVLECTLLTVCTHT
jgi:hypothetical protein